MKNLIILIVTIFFVFHGADLFAANTQVGESISSEIDSIRLKKAQDLLKKRGFYKGRINGIVSPELMNSIGKFQEKNNLKITGKLDSKTISELELGPKNITNEKNDTKLSE